LPGLAAELAQQGFRVPEPFLRLLGNDEFWGSFGVYSNCEFMVPETSDPDFSGPSLRLPFYSDGENFSWYLYLHPSGGSCVLGKGWPDTTVWFVAPSFEAFSYRIWIENQLWQVRNSDYIEGTFGLSPPAFTRPLRDYLDHYCDKFDPPPADPAWF
jgi:hypothetical protein